VAVGDVGEMSNRTWRSWDSTGGDDGGRTGIKHDPGVVGGYGYAEHHSSGEQGRHGLGVSDGAWSEHGAGVIYKQGERGQIKLRGDRVAVGDIGEVQGRTRGAGHAAGGDDGRRAGRERESGMVIRPRVHKHHEKAQPCWYGIGIDDGAWGEHGAGGEHGSNETGELKMRGHRVGVGDVGQVHGRATGERHSAGGDDSRPEGRERESGVVIRPRVDEHHAQGQPCWDGIDIGDGAWGEHGAGVVYGSGKTRTHGMRGDTVGVGDVGQVHCRAWGSEHAAGGDDGR